VYGAPKSLFVASFLGAANRLGGRITARAPAGELRLTLDCNGLTLTLAGDGELGEVVDIALRPESLALAASPPAGGGNTIPGQVVSFAFQGGSTEYLVEIGGASLRVVSPPQTQFAKDAAVWVVIARSPASVFRRDADSVDPTGLRHGS
jgi:ABC-type Fe3+/spermidine/putrescine transport system ATPase subunit